MYQRRDKLSQFLPKSDKPNAGQVDSSRKEQEGNIELTYENEEMKNEWFLEGFFRKNSLGISSEVDKGL